MTASPTGSRYLDAIVEQLHDLVVESDHRPIFGFTGVPGVGKSTLVGLLARRLAERGVSCACIPMDGFHLSNAELVRLGLRERKGAIETFDGHGYLALLRRIHEEKDSVVYAPTYDRALEEAVAGSIAVDSAADCVLTEGNYLLANDSPWQQVQAELEAVWFLTLSDEERHRRLLARHVRGGKSRETAREWVAVVDDVNAKRISETRERANFTIEMDRLDEVTSDITHIDTRGRR